MSRTGIRTVGLATIGSDGAPLDVSYPDLELGSAAADYAIELLDPERGARALPAAMAALIGHNAVRDVRRVAIAIAVPDLDQPIRDFHDAFLRLHLLSRRLVRPNQISFSGLLEAIGRPIAWTSFGPCPPEHLGDIRIRARTAGLPFAVHSVFPVPPMLDYVTPSGVAIADSRRVLLGAYLAPGTMVTPEGFCGVNAGTLGPCMVEGRISAGVVIGAGSHIGGGASIMGTYSGGGRHKVSVGERCLLGANSGIGISLGDGCIVEAGCYVTAGALVTLPDGTTVKAAELAGRAGLLFRRNSVSGRLEAIENDGRWSGLNPLLHRYGSDDCFPT